jgi:rfaE bifunctional protein kinase chain/domain
MDKDLLQIVSEFPFRRIALIGDFIADEFLYGQIARVSREAPVLVLNYRETVRVPGGAANAANNLLDLGCKVCAVGAVGADDAGSALVRLLADKGANVRLIARREDYTTPVKTRILAGAHHSAPQQIVRIDKITQLEAAFDAQSWKRLSAELEACDGVILSDYGYGAITDEISRRASETARRRKIPIVVDSRFRMSEFCGVTALTPNITELEAAVGCAIDGDQPLLCRVAGEVLRKQKLQSLLVTQGRYGMTLFQARRSPVQIPVYGTDEVADVTGAGDTVIAVFTLALACGAAAEQAARLANYAGGIVVMKRGTATVNGSELKAAVGGDNRGLR